MGGEHSEFFSMTQGIIPLVANLVVIVGALYGAFRFIDARIEARMKDPDLISRIARSIDPNVVFDGTGTVIADHGALTLIDRLDVQHERGWVHGVTVIFKEFRNAQPFLTCLDPHVYKYKYSRVEGRGWHVSLVMETALMGAEPPKFRLHVL